MNGEARPALIPSAAAATLALAFAALAGGCADIHRALETTRVNPESPVAATVAAGARRNYAVPLLRDVPPVPKNVPAAGEVKAQVGSLVACRRAMAGYVVDHPPLSGQAAAFATGARDALGISAADVPAPDSAAKAQAYADQLRAEAAPPAAIGGGTAPTAQDALPPTPGARSAAAPPRAQSAAPLAPAVATASAPSMSATPAAVAVGEVPALPPPLPDPLLARCS